MLSVCVSVYVCVSVCLCVGLQKSPAKGKADFVSLLLSTKSHEI